MDINADARTTKLVGALDIINYPLNPLHVLQKFISALG